MRSLRRILWLVTGFVCVACLIPSASLAAAKPRAERPTYTVGEKWIRTDGAYELVHIENGCYVFLTAKRDREIDLTQDLAVVKVRKGTDVMTFDAPPKLVWPLELGSSGSGQVNWYRSWLARKPTVVTYTWKVEAYEDVQTRAGTFGAFRIAHSITWTAQRGGVKRQFALWYAPETHQYVKAGEVASESGDDTLGFFAFQVVALDRPASAPLQVTLPALPDQAPVPTESVPLAGTATAAAQRDVGGPPSPGAGAPAPAAEAWAVLIGINRYQHPRIPKLRYAVNDAQAVERALLAQGYHKDRIFTLTDDKATKAGIEQLLGDELRQQVGANDRVLVFFAGHGKTDRLRSGEEEGYLIPVDGDPSRLFSTAVSMTALRQISDRLTAKHILYIVDACYSGYAIYNRSISEDLLEEMVKKPAIQILTAGRQQDEAQERAGHGVFTEVLVRGLSGEAFAQGRSWLALEELGLWVKQRVFAESNKKQLPQYGNLSGEGQYVFQKAGPPVGSLAITAKVPGVEVWLGDRKIGETTRGETLLVPDLSAGTYQLRARKPGHKEWTRKVEVAPDQRVELAIGFEELGYPPVIRGEDGAEMVLIPAGDFWMGNTPDGLQPLREFCKRVPQASVCKDERYERDELPRHRVTLDAFFIDRFLVTNAQFGGFVRATGHRTFAEIQREAKVWRWDNGSWKRPSVANAYWRSPSGSGGLLAEPTHPVVQVSWSDAAAYCKWAGKRLPTEAEWEKAARGPDGRRYPWGDAWDPTKANGEAKLKRTTPVGSYPQGASPHGVHDMAGNVLEWVADWYAEDYYKTGPTHNPRGPEAGEFRVTRGGSWLDHPAVLAATFRHPIAPSYSVNVVGFRCAKSP